MTMLETERTTAQNLGALRRELIAEGVSEESAECIVVEAAAQQFRGGYGYSVQRPSA